MTALHQRQRMRDRATHLSIVSDSERPPGYAIGWQDTQPAEPKTLNHCQGPCDQGRKLCPCPTACERPSESETAARVREVVAWVIALLLLIGIGHAAIRFAQAAGLT